MGLLVHKYGGTSLGSPSLVKRAAMRISESLQAGDSVAVVVSAMAKQTDNLLGLAHKINKNPPPRELDMLLATGEQASAAVLSMALMEQGIESESYAAWQLPIHSDGNHLDARIVRIETKPIKRCVKKGVVAVITGFQGVDEKQQINTLGRGGSDTSAVALAVALKADECRIYTDVAGVYTADPRIVKKASVLKSILFEEMLELAGQGARVLHPRAVALAGRHQMPVRVLANSDDMAKGTLLGYNTQTATAHDGADWGAGRGTLKHASKKLQDVASGNTTGKAMEGSLVSGISYNDDEAKIDLVGVPDIPGVAAKILGTVANAGIDVDVIVQSTGKDGTTNLGFTLGRAQVGKAEKLLRTLIKKELDSCELQTDSKIAKISLVGSGMRGHAGVASKMFAVLAKHEINIEMISTSEIKITVVIAQNCLKTAVNVLHESFNLARAA